MALEPGVRLGPYEILRPIGAGGMGEVHRARHLKLRRDVAIKVLPTDLAADRTRLARFEREARTASALNHPNIVTIHDIAEHEGTTYLAMELVEGRTLRDLIADGPLPVDRGLRIAEQIADGLAKAHAAGILHRDIKPANVMVTGDGLVKILDFGLAKPLTTTRGEELTAGTLTDTREGMIVGTPHYMSPEQLSGDPVDHRSDQFAFGVVVYEMMCGKPPFDGPSLGAVISSILVAPTPPLRHVRPEVPAELERIIFRCLEKDPDRRFPSTAALGTELRRYGERRARAAHGVAATLRQPAVAGAMGTVLLALGVAAWLWWRGADARWAETQALAEITSLIETGDLYEAYRIAREAERYRPDDPELQRLVDRMTLPVTVNTEPSGAEVLVKGYATPDAPWERIGITPMTLRIPYAMMRWRIVKAGYEVYEGAPFSGASVSELARGVVLDAIGTRPPGSVRIPGGPINALPGIGPLVAQPLLEVRPFYLGRFEVTNREYREFVVAGAYENREWWPEVMQRGGTRITWDDAMNEFRDATGQLGPATWELGTFPAGEDEHPVSGISWYEAAAYCAYAGKSLPTLFHWFSAIGQDQLSDILLHSNMDGTAKAPVGQFRGLGAYGTYDMAGNVKEWVSNAAGDLRYILGGSWNEPTYVFRHRVAHDPWDREPTYGVRCAQFPEPPSEQLLAPVAPPREYPQPSPLSSEAFAVLRGLYEYDRDSLDARGERVNDSLPNYRRETISIRTAYGNERMEVHLLIPHDGTPPYQSVIWFPGGDVYTRRTSDGFASEYLFDFLPRGGRVVVHPVYDGMYERFEEVPVSLNDRRDMTIRWAKDIMRTIDYLETRPDFDATKIAYYGFSGGANFGPVFTAVEPRLRASILLGAGLIPRPFRPEADPAQFAPQSRAPTLMINGRDDFLLPYELSQLPFFERLGAPEDLKRLARLEGGHIPTNRLEIVREVLDWLDLHLGPVRRSARVSGAPEQR